MSAVQFTLSRKRKEEISDNVVRKVGSHCHELSAARLEAAVVVTRVKRRAEETMEMTAQVINQCTTSLSHAAQGALLTLRALKQMVRRRRNKLGTPLGAPINLETLIIPEEFTTHVPHHGEISALPLFCQIYVILAEALGGVHSVLYALLLDKSRRTYDRPFDMMKGIVPEANPRSISCDFEMAAFNAVRTAFPGVRLHEYKNDSDFALQAKMVIALAFVPTDGLEQAIDSLAGHLPDELQPLDQ
ncbi:hypothetical protein T10_9890 [Trichinella papuae]|uniref:MULE transposase domain-containing protein n=1 Tax=Trichinella papuae TaxID=268474 RepID=A0A0V1M0Q2_9BILA|nr:hypothetical protein T10_9890 [Trichinella papuae]